MSDFDNYDEKKVIEMAQNGVDEAMDYLLDKYRYIPKVESRTVYLIGAEQEDLIQEGMIGLFKAIGEYDLDRDVAFNTFATSVVRNRIKYAITKSNRDKHKPLNGYISIYSSAENSDGEDGLSELKDKSINSNPENSVVLREEKQEMLDRIKKELSSYENKVASLYLEGLSYLEIADKLGKTEKSIDNALSRIRKKLS